MKKILSSNKGFSLIELIVVIAILGVLVGVAAPNLIGYVHKTRVSADIANLETVKRAAQAYVAEKEVNAATATDITTEVGTDKFNGTLPTLKSVTPNAITVSVTGSVVTVSPTVTPVP